MNDVGGSESGTGLRAATSSKSSRTSDANFENFEDSEWDVGIGNLIIDLDADIEKNNEANRTGNNVNNTNNNSNNSGNSNSSSSSSGSSSSGGGVVTTTGSSVSSSTISCSNTTTTITTSSSSSSTTTTSNNNSSSTNTNSIVVGTGQQTQQSSGSSSQMHIPRIPGNSSSSGGSSNNNNNNNSNVTSSSLKGSKVPSSGGVVGGGNSAIISSNNSTSSIVTGNTNSSTSSASSSSSSPATTLSSLGSGGGTKSATSADLSKSLSNISMEHLTVVEKGLKMKIKRSKPGTKSVDAKHEIVKSDVTTLSSANVSGKNSSLTNSNDSKLPHGKDGKQQQDKDNSNLNSNANNTSGNMNPASGGGTTSNNKGMDDTSANSTPNSNNNSGNNNNDQGPGIKVKAPKRGSTHKKVKNSAGVNNTNANNTNNNSATNSPGTGNNSNKKDVNSLDNKSTNNSSSTASAASPLTAGHVANKHDMMFSVNLSSPSASAFVKTSSSASLKVPLTTTTNSSMINTTSVAGNLIGHSADSAFRSQQHSNSSSSNAINSSNISPWSTASPNTKDGNTKGQGRLSPSVTTDKISNSPSYGKKSRVFVPPTNEKPSNLEDMVVHGNTPTNSYRTVTLSSASLNDLNNSSIMHQGPLTQSGTSMLSNFNSNTKDAQKTATKGSPMSTQDVCVGTSVGTVTEPDCLGPCEPGTSVTLEGIVWHETESGVLVVNVTWRGKTYVGTLLDCTKNDWAPPRFCDSPTSDLEMRNPKNRGKRGRAQQAATPVNEPTPAEVRTSNAKLRNGVKGRRGSSTTNATTTTNAFATPVSPLKQESYPKRKTRGSENESQEEPSTAKNAKRPKVSTSSKDNANSSNSKDRNSPAPQSNSSSSSNSTSLDSLQQSSGPSSPALIECPEPNCSKKYKHINGLRYHQAHAHSNNFTPEQDSDSNMSTTSTTNNLSVDTKSENNVGNNNVNNSETTDTVLSNSEKMDIDMDIVSSTDGENTSSAPTTPAKRNNNTNTNNNNANSTKEAIDKIYDIHTDMDINLGNTSNSSSSSSNTNKEAMEHEQVSSATLNKSTVNSSNKVVVVGGIKLNSGVGELNNKDMDKSVFSPLIGTTTTTTSDSHLKDINTTTTSLSLTSSLSSSNTTTTTTTNSTPPPPVSTIGRPPILTVPVPYSSRPLIHNLSGHHGHANDKSNTSSSSSTLNRDDSLNNVMKNIPSANNPPVVSKGAPWQPHALSHSPHTPHTTAHVISSLHPQQSINNNPVSLNVPVPIIGSKDHHDNNNKSKSNKDKSSTSGNDLSLLQQQQQPPKKPKHKKKSKEKDREKGGGNNNSNTKGGNLTSSSGTTKGGMGGHFSGPNSSSDKGKDMLDRRSSSLDDNDKDGKGDGSGENPQSPAYSDISDANESGPEIDLNVVGGGSSVVKESSSVKPIPSDLINNKKDPPAIAMIPPSSSHGLHPPYHFSPFFYNVDPNSNTTPGPNNPSGNQNLTSSGNTSSSKPTDGRTTENSSPLLLEGKGKGSKQSQQQQQPQPPPPLPPQSHPSLHGLHSMPHIPTSSSASSLSADDRRSPKVDYNMSNKYLPPHYFAHHYPNPYSNPYFDQPYGPNIMTDNAYPGSRVFMEEKEREFQMGPNNPNNTKNNKGDNNSNKDESSSLNHSLIGNIKQEPGLDVKDNRRDNKDVRSMSSLLSDKDGGGHDIKSEFADSLYGEKRTNLNLLPPGQPQQQPHFMPCSKHSKDAKSRDSNKDGNDLGKDSSSSSASSKSGRNSIDSKNNKNIDRENNDNDLKDGKDHKNEGQKPTMETQGPPPPPTPGTYAYIPQSYLQGPSFWDPSHPLYARQVLVPGHPYAGSPYHGMHPNSMPRFPPAPGSTTLPLPEDLSRPSPPGNKALDLLQHHAAQYYASHKIHELQERALKSPSPQVGGPNSVGGGGGVGQNLSSASSSPGGLSERNSGRSNIVGSGNSSTITPGTNKAADLTKDTKPPTGVDIHPNSQGQSRSPPTQHHVHSHTHHHTHVGIVPSGYPIIPTVSPQYSPHSHGYGGKIVLTPPLSGIGSAGSVISTPYPASKPN